MSCFILISSWSSALVHGRKGGSRGGSAGFGWRIRKVGDGGAFGFGVNVSVEVPGGMVEVTFDVVSPRWP